MTEQTEHTQTGRADGLLSQAEARLFASEEKTKQTLCAFLEAWHREGASFAENRGTLWGGADAKTLSAVCRLIGSADRMRRALREEILSLSAAERTLASWKQTAAHEAVRSGENGGRETEPLPEFQARARNAAERLYALREQLTRFSSADLPELCSRLSEAADLSGEGKRASLAALAEISGKLRFRTERLLAVLSGKET